MTKAIVIVSGGLDSTTLLHYVVKEEKREVYPLSFNYGQKHSYELECAEWHVRHLQKEGYPVNEHRVVDMQWYADLIRGASALTDKNITVPTLEEVIGEPQPITYVPFRNLLFLTIAAGYAEAVGASEIYYGAQQHDEYSGYWDTTKFFLEKVNTLYSLNRKNTIRVIAPFVELHKSDIIKIGLKLGVDYAKTWTCYKGPNEKGEACGVCPTCRDRLKAWKDIGMEDPLPYAKR